MKQLILSVALLVAIGLISCKEQPKNETTAHLKTETIKAAIANASFGVRGNCGMCKNTIEKAAKEVDGVVKATWDVDQKKIGVSFDSTKTNVMAVQTAIASSGYDTEKVAGNLEAYEALPSCCKYDHAMTMNQS